ncbi:MAG: ABC transporter ATP-binding protein [Pyrinomonadaceae bacterium]|jgi:putative ABC transport system ATP-binding protein|nr:ABC transporter ATP-binding protein [Pyrinomonadaceae bacterium]
MLKAIDLTKIYKSGTDEYHALKSVNIEISNNDCLAIIGKSGSGKSTLMHLLACLDSPTSGSILFDGNDISTLNEKELNLLRNEKFGFVFQQFFLNGRDTVLDNVLLPMKIRGASQYRMIKDAMEALEAVGLKDKEDKKAKDLSGGEKQRVCIARALVGQPKVIFADEPTGNLDSANSEMIEDMLFRLNREKQIALIVVTHDPELANKCSRKIELKDGQIVGDS